MAIYDSLSVIEITCARHEVVTIYGNDEGYIVIGTDRKRTYTKEGRGSSISRAFNDLLYGKDD